MSEPLAFGGKPHPIRPGESFTITFERDRPPERPHFLVHLNQPLESGRSRAAGRRKTYTVVMFPAAVVERIEWVPEP